MSLSRRILCRSISVGAPLIAAVALAAPQQGLTEAPPFLPEVAEPSRTAEKESDSAPAEASILGDLLEADGRSTVDEALGNLESGPEQQLLALLREVHPWGRFEPGAWRQVRVVTEAFDSDGQVSGRTVTQRRETLMAFDERHCTIEVENIGTLAGRLAPSPPELRQLSLLTGRPVVEGAETTVTQGDPTSVSLGGVALPCQRWSLTTLTPSRTDVETLCFSSEGTPRLTRRESRSTTGESAVSHRLQTVTREGLPIIYGEELVDSWQVASVHTHHDGARTEREAIHSSAAPGGLHVMWATEYDASGRRVFWSVTELVASGLSEDDTVGGPDDEEDSAEATLEVRPRRFMRLLRRSERAAEAAP